MAAILSGATPLLQVFDMPSAVRFYRHVLGFEVASHSSLIRGIQGKYFHRAIPTLAAPTWRKLRVTAHAAPKITGDGTKLFTISDPDGYHLCFQWAATT
jgi:catechol 2,3-dioxygenase-like lactoylglutathione lyase family enzyme